MDNDKMTRKYATSLPIPQPLSLMNSNGVLETYSTLGLQRSILVRRKPATWTLCPTLLIYDKSQRRLDIPRPLIPQSWMDPSRGKVISFRRDGDSNLQVQHADSESSSLSSL